VHPLHFEMKTMMCP